MLSPSIETAEEIRKTELAEPEGNKLAISFNAPNHSGTRYYVDRDGKNRSKEFQQLWLVSFEFDSSERLIGIEAFLVSAKGQQDHKNN